jgi:putative oxidoreductase
MEKISFLGRLIVGGYFLYSAYNHFTNVGSMAAYAASSGVPAAQAAIVLTGLLLLIGGLCLITGLYPKIGIAALVLFLIPVSFTMHAFWNIADPMARMGQMINFLKNMALLGSALTFLAIPEPWPMSLGNKKQKQSPETAKYGKTG